MVRSPRGSPDFIKFEQTRVHPSPDRVEMPNRGHTANRKARLGDTDTDKPYIRRAQNYQTIDATAVTTELFGIGHNYYSDNPTILWDMMCTIGETRPQDRALEIARYGGLPDGDEYYRVNASIVPSAQACSLRRTAFPVGGRAAVGVGDEDANRADC